MGVYCSRTLLRAGGRQPLLAATFPDLGSELVYWDALARLVGEDLRRVVESLERVSQVTEQELRGEHRQGGD